MPNIPYHIHPSAILEAMEDVVMASRDLSLSRAERQMAEAQEPAILMAGLLFLHPMSKPVTGASLTVAGMEEVFALLDTGWEQWRLSILRDMDDEGDLTAEDFLKAVLHLLYESPWYEDQLNEVDRKNDNRPLHGTKEGERYYSGSGESPDDPSYESYLNRPGPIPGWY
jgi:hypothetical protein